MTSKSSFSDLMRENIKRRYWSAALSLLLFFFIYPVGAMFSSAAALSEDELSYAEMRLGREAALAMARSRLLADWKTMVSADNVMIVFIMLLLAAALTFSGFRYLHSKQQTDFYHSLPVSRTRMFLAVNLNSLLIAAVPMLLMNVIGAVIIQVNTGSASCVPYALKESLFILFFFLLFSMTALLALLLTGNLIVGLLGFGVFLWLGPVFVTTIFWMQDRFFRTAWTDNFLNNRITQYSSPFALFIKVDGSPAWQRALIALAAAAVLFCLNLFLARIRPSEAAEKAMAFPKSEAPVKFAVVVTVGLVGAMMFSELRGSLGWALFGMVCGVLVTHCLMEIIYRFDFRNLFARKLQLLACFLLTLGIFSVFRFDLAGYDRWIPAEDKVAGAGLFSDSVEPYYYQMTAVPVLKGNDGSHWIAQERSRTIEGLLSEMELSDLDAVRRAAELGVAALNSSGERFTAEPTAEWQGAMDAAHYGAVTICWHLKSGRDVLRTYYMDLTPLRDELDRIQADPAFRKALYPVLSMTPEEVAGINYYSFKGADNVPGTRMPQAAAASGVAAGAADASGNAAAASGGAGQAAENTAKILAAYQKEFLALTAETRREEAPIACLQFKDHAFQEAADVIRGEQDGSFEAYLGVFNSIGWYPVYPSFHETLKALSACGVDLDPAEYADGITALQFTDVSPAPEDLTPDEEASGSWRKPQLLVTDKELIRECLSGAVFMELPYNDAMTVTYSSVDCTAVLQSETEETQDLPAGDLSWMQNTRLMKLRGGHVPAEIREAFGPEDEEAFRRTLTTAY